MDEPVELHNIVGHTSSVDGETIYEVPEVPKDDENEYMKINTLAERMTTSRMPRNSTPGNVDGVADIKSESDAAALRKVQIFCLVLLMMLITSSVTIGVLVNTLMQRTGDLKLKISELQNRPGALTGTDSTNIQELQVKVIQLERDTSQHTSLIHDHGSRILDHGSRITQLEIETAANDDNIVQQGKIISNLETAKTVDAASFHIINNTLELLTIDNSANKEGIQIQQARLNEIESVINLNQDNVQTLNDTMLRLLFDTSSNNVNNKLMIGLLNSSIITLETNLTMQSTIIQDHSHRLEQMAFKIEPATTIRDLNNSLLQLETRVKTLVVAVSNNSISINLIHTDLEMAKNSLANLSNRVTVNEIDKQSDSAAVEDTQQRISRVEMDSNVTEILLQTIESRLTYLQDGLNCTWGNWTSFSSCSATCGDGLQYRERSLEGLVTDSNQQWCARKEIDIQTCIIKSCKPMDGGWGQWSPFSNCSQACGVGTQTRHRACENPEPLYGGAPCLGHTNETQICNTDPCPEDCSGFTSGSPTDGVYNISPNRDLTESVPVYCEFTSDGAWTVIQKRFNGSVVFYRTWQEYKTGFGDVNGEYWLGNDAIHNLTSHGTYQLKIRLADWEGNTVFANYTTFRIASESDGYRLSIDGYSGDAGKCNINAVHGICSRLPLNEIKIVCPAPGFK